MKWIIGIDEVGRGALAGPVVVAAAMMPRDIKLKVKELGPVRDSKKLSKKQREAWVRHFKENKDIAYAFSRVYPRGIEKMNVSAAANLAAAKAFERLSLSHGSRTGTKVFLDGGLFLGNGSRRKKAKTVIKGDEKIAAIAVASIVAKVHRDRFMRRLAQKYPLYGFEVHKGYGTKAHQRAIKKYGPCDAHRLTFIATSATMKR